MFLKISYEYILFLTVMTKQVISVEAILKIFLETD